MIIRNIQFDAYRNHSKRSFQNRMTEHLKKHFLGSCNTRGPEDICKAIFHGIERANTYQINTERDVCKYITLMFAFGDDFDVDNRLPWAAEILHNRVYTTGTDRIEALFERAKRHARECERVV